MVLYNYGTILFIIFRHVDRRRPGSLGFNIIWASMREFLTLLLANNKGTYQPVHPRSLISAFVKRILNSPYLGGLHHYKASAYAPVFDLYKIGQDYVSDVSRSECVIINYLFCYPPPPTPYANECCRIAIVVGMPVCLSAVVVTLT